jgi:hypothetical protein
MGIARSRPFLSVDGGELIGLVIEADIEAYLLRHG